MTLETIFAKIDADPETAANAATALTRYMADRSEDGTGWDVALIAALAMQVTSHRLLRSHGLDCPLLAADQLALLRLLLRRHGGALATIAAERTAAREVAVLNGK